jgi:hypothetical protein
MSHVYANSSTSSVYSEFECEPPPSEYMDASTGTGSNVDEAESSTREQSIVSYSSSREGHFLRESDGRVFNAQSDVYYLPAGKRLVTSLICTDANLGLHYLDDVEYDRL